MSEINRAGQPEAWSLRVRWARSNQKTMHVDTLMFCGRDWGSIPHGSTIFCASEPSSLSPPRWMMGSGRLYFPSNIPLGYLQVSGYIISMSSKPQTAPVEQRKAFTPPEGYEMRPGYPYPIPVGLLESDLNLIEMGQKVDKARCMLLARKAWYGHFAIEMEWNSRWNMPMHTFGVCITGAGRLICYWDPMFVATRNECQLASVICHEIEHIVGLHPVRIGETRDPNVWNIAADMVVNGKKDSPNIVYQDTTEGPRWMPFDEEKEGVAGVFLPVKEDPHWKEGAFPEDGTAEAYYEAIREEIEQNRQPCQTCGGSGQVSDDPSDSRESEGGQDGQGDEKDGPGGSGGCGGQGDSRESGQDGSGAKQGSQGHGHGKSKDCPDCHGTGENYGKFGQVMDDHSVWEESSATSEQARQVVHDICDRATKTCGSAPGHLQADIDRLRTPIVNWRKHFRTVYGRAIGQYRRTPKRLPRKRPQFGNFGRTYMGAGRVLVVTDTSGSVSSDEFEQFFSEIESMSQNIIVSVLQWDDVGDASPEVMRRIYLPEYRRGQWKKIHRNGFGGTDMGAAVQFAASHGLLRGCQACVVLTDGITPWFQGKLSMPLINVITTARGSLGNFEPPSDQINVYMEQFARG